MCDSDPRGPLHQYTHATQKALHPRDAIIMSHIWSAASGQQLGKADLVVALLLSPGQACIASACLLADVTVLPGPLPSGAVLVVPAGGFGDGGGVLSCAFDAFPQGCIDLGPLPSVGGPIVCLKPSSFCGFGWVFNFAFAARPQGPIVGWSLVAFSLSALVWVVRLKCGVLSHHFPCVAWHPHLPVRGPACTAPLPVAFAQGRITRC